MRWTLARFALAVTSMVALAFLIPLALLVGRIAHDRAVADARAQAGAVVAALAVTQDRGVLTGALASTNAGAAGHLAIHLPDAVTVGATRAAEIDLSVARIQRQPVTATVPGGMVYLQPTVVAGDRTAVIEVFVPAADLTRGVATARAWIAALAVLLIAGSTLFADRLGAMMSRRVVTLVDSERKLAGDLSHRLRTPLTALRLDTEAIPPGPVADRMRRAVQALEEEVDQIIAGARRPSADRSRDRTDLVDVLAERMPFWAELAEDHGRPWQITGIDEPLWVPVPRADLVGAVDALLGNVFEHTPQGGGFRVHLARDRLVIEDSGPGIPDTSAAMRRGASGSGSTGLGLDIVRRVSGLIGGDLVIDRGDLGGARVTMTLTRAPRPSAVR
jgi:signal transduction histidine kinase